MIQSRSENLVSTAIHQFSVRQRAETEVLALFASSPRRAGDVLAEFDADLSWFAEEDHRAICCAIDRAAKSPAPQSVEEIARFARDLLRRLNRWNDADERPFVTNCAIWGPGPLSALLTLVEFNAEELRHSCRRLVRIINTIQEMECNHHGD